MIPVGIVTIVTLLYVSLLFAVAYHADRRREAGHSLISNPYIYALSLAVYFTSWTFFGSVGRAATSGIDFLPIYLGPTLIAFSWWFLLRKMVRISKEQNIVSIADFISSRFGKSASLGAIVTIFAVVGIMPYIALQLKAVSKTFDILTIPAASLSHGVHHHFPLLPGRVDTAFMVALLLGLFGVLFGARHLDASERHEGLVAAVATESLVKLISFLAVGVVVTFGLFDGPVDIISRFISHYPQQQNLLLIDTEKITYPGWFSLTFISMMAIMFLPRQFHIMVIENSDEKHITTAMWCFPAYMFLLNLFVVPIALGGLLINNGNTAGADYFVLTLPLDNGHPWLALLVFVGGFSAAAGMVMVESVALSTMILNHLIMPVILKFGLDRHNLSSLLINLKRFGIILVIFLGYAYYRLIGNTFALVNIGLISFIAATQFAPAMLGALYWRRANRLGAMTGLLLGFLVWFYTLVIPSFAKSGWVPERILVNGPFDFSMLRPLELFGLSGFDMWTHALFWSLFFNIGAFLTLSLLTSPTAAEEEQTDKFVDVYAPQRRIEPRTRLSKAPTIIEFVELMAKFIGEKQAAQAIAEYVGEREIDARGSLSEYELPNLKRFTERTLAGSVGAAPARIIIENYLSARGSHMEDVFDIFGSVTLSRTSSREQLGILYEVAREVGSGGDLQVILDNVLAMLHQQFKFDLCIIRILDDTRQNLVVRSQHGMSYDHQADSQRTISMDTYIGSAFLTNSVAVVNDTDLLDSPLTASIVHREGIKSFAHAPITIEGEPIGVLSAFSRSSKGIFTDEFTELFKSIAGQIGVAWRNSRQTNELIEAREQEKELAIAMSIQLGLLPNQIPDVAGVNLRGICIPAKKVGGDYYDFLPRGDNRLDLVIADVSGHNIAAALLMAEARAFIQARVQNLNGAATMMDELNTFFFDDLSRSELFITMFYLSYNGNDYSLRYASAGHNPPLLIRKNTNICEELDADGLILGIRRKVSFEERLTYLEPGDLLFLYTDGLIEAEDNEGNLFGELRLKQLLLEIAELPLDDIVNKTLDQARIFSGSHTFRDDVSIVVMRTAERVATT